MYPASPVYFNSANELWEVDSIIDAVKILLEKKICIVDDENKYLLKTELTSLVENNPNSKNLYSLIPNLRYLDFSPILISEVIKTLKDLMVQNQNELSFLGCRLRDEFEAKFERAFDQKRQIKIIKRFLKKTTKELEEIISNIQVVELHQYYTNDNLLDLIEGFFRVVGGMDRENAQIFPNDKWDCFIHDLLVHVCPPGESILNMYETGHCFLMIRDLNNFFASLKDKLSNINHSIIELKSNGVFISHNNYSKKRLIPMEQICLIEQLRHLDITISSMPYEKQIKYLEIINPDIKKNIEDKLKRLISAVETPIEEHESFIEATATYAKMLNQISNSSIENLKKAIRNHKRSYINKPKGQKLSPKEIRNNEMYKKSRPAIEKATKNVMGLINQIN